MTTQVALDNPEANLPVFHSNGNSPRALGGEYFNALRCFDKFSEQFFAVEFHKRDYYILGDEYWDAAVKQRDEVKKKLSDIRAYLEMHSQHCFESVK
jgi:hypothetical protein